MLKRLKMNHLKDRVGTVRRNPYHLKRNTVTTMLKITHGTSVSISLHSLLSFFGPLSASLPVGVSHQLKCQPTNASLIIQPQVFMENMHVACTYVQSLSWKCKKTLNETQNCSSTITNTGYCYLPFSRYKFTA